MGYFDLTLDEMNKTNVKEIYLNINRIKTSEGDLVVSPKHKIYVGESDSTVNLPSYNVMNLPSKFLEDFSLSNLENSLNNVSGLSCGILNQIIENIVSLLYKNLSVKSQSLVTNTLCSDLDSSASSPFESPFGLKITSKSFLRNCNNSFLTFSSSRNLSFLSFEANNDIVTSLSETCSILQSCFNMLLCDRYKECIKNLFYWNPSFEHLQDLPNHDSCTFESWLSMTNFTICNNIFVNFDSHNIEYIREIFKTFDSKFRLMRITDVYMNINQGTKIIFMGEDGEEIKILSIEKEKYNGKI